MDIKYKLKKLTPMKQKKKINNDCYFIKIDENWYNLFDLYENINKNNYKDINNNDFTIENIRKIKHLYNNIIEVDDDTNDKLLNDYIEIFESQINELYSNQEELYATTQTQQHELEKLKQNNCVK